MLLDISIYENISQKSLPIIEMTCVDTLGIFT